MSSPAELFVAALGSGHPQLAEAYQRELEAHVLVVGGGIDEARACLSAACAALGQSIGGAHTHRVHTGDDAFKEIRWINGLRLDRQRSEAAASLTTALELAAERLGPLPGGRLASFRHPTQAPAQVPSPEPPTDGELGAMAADSGRAVALLSRAGHVNGLAVLGEILAAVGERTTGQNPV